MVTVSNCTMAAEERSNTPFNVVSFINLWLCVNLYMLCNLMRFSYVLQENIIFTKLVIFTVLIFRKNENTAMYFTSI